MRKLFLSAAVAALSVTPAFAKPSAEAYGGHSVIRNVVLSPGGEYVGTIALQGDQSIVTISKVGTNQICRLGSGGNRVRSIMWATDRRLIVEASKFGELSYDDGGDTSGDWGQTYSINTNCGDPKRMAGNSVMGRTLDGHVVMTGVTINDTKQSQATLRRWTKTNVKINLRKVDPETGDGRLYEDGSDYTGGWVVDGDGNAKMRIDYDQGTGHPYVFARLGTAKEWTLVYDGRDAKSQEDLFSFSGLGVRPDTAVVYGRRGDRRGVYEYDFRTRQVTRPIMEHPRVDVLGVVRGNYTGEVVGAAYAEEGYTVEYFDRTYAQMQADLKATFPGESVQIVSVSKDRKRFIANVEGATNPGGIYYFIENGEIAEIGREHPALTPQDIATVKFIHYTARDGLSIPAYLTIPYGSSGKNLPLVVMPHGGPEARDYGGFDGWAQFLASRGYVVLQPQFRGSEGFGKPFRDAGRQKWGLEMQHDITDGVRYLINNGTADGSRVAIVGWSYGGYATLAGLAFTPELYRAGVAGAPVADLPTFYQWFMQRNTGGRFFNDDSQVTRMLGNPHRDAQRLIDTSPARHADKFRAPVLLVHGEQDRTVPPEQSKIMLDALKKAGKQADMVMIGGDDHYLSSPTTGREFLSRVEAFLAQHMK